MFIPICRAPSILLHSSFVFMSEFWEKHVEELPLVMAAIWLSYIPFLQTLLSTRVVNVCVYVCVHLFYSVLESNETLLCFGAPLSECVWQRGTELSDGNIWTILWKVGFNDDSEIVILQTTGGGCSRWGEVGGVNLTPKLTAHQRIWVVVQSHRSGG